VIFIDLMATFTDLHARPHGLHDLHSLQLNGSAFNGTQKHSFRHHRSQQKAENDNGQKTEQNSNQKLKQKPTVVQKRNRKQKPELKSRTNSTNQKLQICLDRNQNRCDSHLERFSYGYALA